ncbi:MAG: urea carboxylase-associated family protein [Actinomycetes bacterium]
MPSDAKQTVEIGPQSGGWVKLDAGERLRVVDVAGQQVADLFAVASDDFDKWLSTSTSRGVAWKLFPPVGATFFTTAFEPLLTFEADDSPGIHDMLFSVCRPEMYAAIGATLPHPSCHENFRIAASQFGWNPDEVPDPVNFFQCTAIGDDKTLTPLPAPSKAGDSVTLRADRDVYVVVTACSMDVEPINGEACTGLRLEVLAP